MKSGEAPYDLATTKSPISPGKEVRLLRIRQSDWPNPYDLGTL